MASEPLTISVGPEGADIVGSDNRAIQAAVDYVAALGGGVVRLLPGLYTMRDSLHLRSRVRVLGGGHDTVLCKAQASVSPLGKICAYGEYEVTVVKPDGFEPGCGISLKDDRHDYFDALVATIIGREGPILRLSRMVHAEDYEMARGAVAATTYPVISGYHVHSAIVENLAVDGNAAHNPHLDGCRGAGIYLYGASQCTIRRCLARNYHGDGISFQNSRDILVEDSECSGNTHLGIHPGGGSQRPVVRNCWAYANGQAGLFLCWRVRHGRFENNRLADNGQSGISIGHQDTDNLFLGNLVAKNGQHGIHFRDETEQLSGHRNTFEDCEIVDNPVGVFIDGVTDGTTFRRCFIGSRGLGAVQRVGVRIGPKAGLVSLEELELLGNETDVEDMRRDCAK